MSETIEDPKMWLLFALLICVLDARTSTTELRRQTDKVNDLKVIMMLKLGGVRISDTIVSIMGTTISTFVDLSAFSDRDLEKIIRDSPPSPCKSVQNRK